MARTAFNRCTKEYLLNRILAFKVATKFNCRFHLILFALRIKPFTFLINCFFFRFTISLPKVVNSSARINTVVVRRCRLDFAVVAASLKYIGHSGVHWNYHGMLLDQPWLRLNRFLIQFWSWASVFISATYRMILITIYIKSHFEWNGQFGASKIRSFTMVWPTENHVYATSMRKKNHFEVRALREMSVERYSARTHELCIHRLICRHSSITGASVVRHQRLRVYYLRKRKSGAGRERYRGRERELITRVYATFSYSPLLSTIACEM